MVPYRARVAPCSCLSGRRLARAVCRGLFVRAAGVPLMDSGRPCSWVRQPVRAGSPFRCCCCCCRCYTAAASTSRRGWWSCPLRRSSAISSCRALLTVGWRWGGRGVAAGSLEPTATAAAAAATAAAAAAATRLPLKDLPAGEGWQPVPLLLLLRRPPYSRKVIAHSSPLVNSFESSTVTCSEVAVGSLEPTAPEGSASR
jgi:hypothetical protein